MVLVIWYIWDMKNLLSWFHCLCFGHSFPYDDKRFKCLVCGRRVRKWNTDTPNEPNKRVRQTESERHYCWAFSICHFILGALFFCFIGSSSNYCDSYFIRKIYKVTERLRPPLDLNAIAHRIVDYMVTGLSPMESLVATNHLIKKNNWELTVSDLEFVVRRVKQLLVNNEEWNISIQGNKWLIFF